MPSSPSRVNVFDVDAAYVSGRDMTFRGVPYRAGDVIPTPEVASSRNRLALVNSGFIKAVESVQGGEGVAPVVPESSPLPFPAEGTVSDVLDWVGDDDLRAAQALELEDVRKPPRASLLTSLEKIVA